MQTRQTMKLVIVTGMSGSGKTIVLNTLEDLGYNCIDNLPAFLLAPLASELNGPRESRFKITAVAIDARNPPDDLESIPELLKPLRDNGIEPEIIFLEAQDETLIKRYSETRRKHPLSNDDCSLAEAIQRERTLLAPLQSAADLRIDTSHTNLHDLRHIVRSRISGHEDQELSLLFQSFGYKKGVPRDADFVYDVRCLPNPHWQQHLRPLTGKDPEVAAFLESDTQVTRMKQEITDYLAHWIPCFESDGRSYLTVAIGCTGGQHRSVYMVEQLASHFQESGRKIMIRHQELE